MAGPAFEDCGLSTGGLDSHANDHHPSWPFVPGGVPSRRPRRGPGGTVRSDLQVAGRARDRRCCGLDGKGLPVRGLSRDDFAILEDGKPQPIASFEAFAGAATEEEALPRRGPVRWPRTPPFKRGRAIFVLLVDDMSLAPRSGRRGPEGPPPLRFREPPRRRRGDLHHLEWRRLVERADAGGPRGRPGPRGARAGAQPPRQRRRLRQRVGGLPHQYLRRLRRPEGGARPGAALGRRPRASGSRSGLTQRVFDRFMARRVCDPLAAGFCYMPVRGAGQRGRPAPSQPHP